MYELKPISTESIPSALRKAEGYRIHGEPREAESVCDDVLAVDPTQQEALALKLLSIVDRFDEDIGDEVDDAKSLLPRFQDERTRAYYAGIICERRGKVLFTQQPEAGPAVFDWLHKAMQWFEHADGGPESDHARLRWNTCARMINRHKHIRPAPGPPSGEWRIKDFAQEQH